MIASTIQKWGGASTCESNMPGVVPSQCSELVTIALLFALALRRLDAYFLIILLKCREVFAGLGKLSLLHTLADIPVHKGALGVHQIKLVVDARKDLGDGSRV